MKKFLTLVLALVLALALTVPAMAFTDNKYNDSDNPYEVDIYLVEYEDDEFFGFTGMPPSDRGYAKNEIVAAIAELYIPKNADDLDSEDYPEMVFDGDSVNFNLTDNKENRRISSNLKGSGAWAKPSSDEFGFAFDDDIMLDNNDTYKWLFFAKVTGDEASITATLKSFADDFEDVGDTLNIDDDYEVEILGEGDGGDDIIGYSVSEGNTLLFEIFVNSKDKTTGLTIYLDGTTPYEVVGLKSGLGFLKPTGGGLLDPDVSAEKAIIRDLMAIYNDVFVDVFGFDFDKLGGVVDADTFLSIVGSDDISATVEIKPWTAYVSVPDVVVIDPPKTGGAASVVGFVMIALAAAAVVAARKVRA